jgi:hypothetical protein
MGRPLYVETRIRADIDRIWHHTQEPGAHARWDLRFTRIDPLPSAGGPTTRFRYSLRVLPGVVVAGEGATVGEHVRADGTRTSALRFASTDPRSLIRDGAGYWRYVPTGTGVRAGESSAVRFLTGYDYRPGWGRFGSVADRAFRPWLGWATAWSFDRLRLWLERGISPRRALLHGLGEVAVRAGLVAAAAAGGWWWSAVTAAVVAVLMPPAPTTPAARRCRRRPPDRLGARAPSTLDTLPPVGRLPPAMPKDMS